MKITGQKTIEVTIETPIPAYYEHGNGVMFISDDKLHGVMIEQFAHGTRHEITSGVLPMHMAELFVNKGTAITKEKFSREFDKAVESINSHLPIFENTVAYMVTPLELEKTA